jgi:AraC-like DNA-binding protein
MKIQNITANVYKPLLYIWEKRTLFIGSLEEPLNISTGASTLLLGLDNPIRFITNEMQTSIECRSLLISAGTDVVIDTQGAIIANCTLEPLGRDLHVLSRLIHNSAGGIGYDLKNEQMLIDTFWRVCCSPFDTVEINKSLVKILNLKTQHLQDGQRPHDVDPRIEHVITLIQNTSNLNLSLSELAKKANLSPSRLTQLFKKQTGLPLRRYRLWHRLYMTALKVGQKKNLTEAAFEAGFNDSPHFNRTFRSMLGISPTCVLSQTLQVIIPDINQDKPSTINQAPCFDATTKTAV